MASICILLILTVPVISIGNAATDFPNVKCKKETLGLYGRESLLECVVETPYDDTTIRWITWIKASRIVLDVVDKKVIAQEPGYWYDPPSSWTGRRMTVYLRINKTEVKHGGPYEVKVLTDRGHCTDSTTLQVTAKYQKPTITEAKNSNNGRTLVCESGGGFPKGKLLWFDGHKELISSPPMETNQSGNGLFHLRSMLTVGGGSSEANYSCRVFNFSGGREHETHFPVLDSAETQELGQNEGPNLNTKIVAPLVVIGSLIVGLLLLILYRRRSQMARRQSTAPLMGGHLQVPTEDNGGVGASHDP
ncbi:uncharacterized protein zgc:174863 isoform X2 [Pungitius pungitius]|uniref:uncharacterized protein zgc:174863 isoform X2 n=1 Tax=Pungitius pungitius TaxID=134920 RepID=UPI002E11B5AF